MADSKPIRILITGGGTGGHLFPGIALAQGVLRQYPGSRVCFVGTERHLDQRTLARLQLECRTIAASGLKGKSLLERCRAVLQIPVSVYQAFGIIRQFRPDLVFGVGGYVTGPVIVAARLLGIPCCIHEQNSVPGLANRLLGSLVQKIFLSIPGSETFFPAAKTVLTGNPVRADLLAAAREETPTIEPPPVVLVLGGSQGAHRINELMVEAMQAVNTNLPPAFRIIHQTGAADLDFVAAAYAQLGITATTAAFFDDMAEVYRQASLLVARAGATTLAETTLFRKPALLIPYPFAADNHQELNARLLADKGAARLFIQAELDGARLGQEIVSLLQNRPLLRQMGDRAGEFARPQATELIVGECLRLIKKKASEPGVTALRKCSCRQAG